MSNGILGDDVISRSTEAIPVVGRETATSEHSGRLLRKTDTQEEGAVDVLIWRPWGHVAVRLSTR
jgi:hypothetical protein